MNNITQIKSRRIFENFDILIYSLLIFSVFALFLFCVIIPKNKSISGFSAKINDETLFSYYFDGQINISDNYINLIDFDNENHLITVFFNSEHTEFNILEFDDATRYVKMQNSTCSKTKDCVKEKALNYNNIIYCAPHNLKIIPILNGKTSPTVG